jgi:GGDEF domain-containing protein
MTNLKRSFFWAALYLGFIFIAGQADYTGRPIINFAAYFYLTVMFAVPVTLFFPSVSRLSVYIPLFIWGIIYVVLLEVVDRKLTAGLDLSVIVVEFVLLEAGVWFAHHLAVQIGHAESVMEALALTAFPNRVHDINTESQRIKIEFTRSRRYHRPLSLIVIEMETENEKMIREMLKGIQHDLLNRFTSARVGQIIDERIRQTDLLLRDYSGRFIILCPETDLNSVSLLATRIVQAVRERTSIEILWGAASFPDEALTFDDLLQKGRERLSHFVSKEPEMVATVNAQS